uniref:Nucleoprotein n=1 Tax=Meram virus TaxID=2737675 RepID=A0A7G7Y1S7_9VIRU|nr:nucleoprotein [Meram virus]QNH88013.1 nucleoprotein [Meram virus]
MENKIVAENRAELVKWFEEFGRNNNLSDALTTSKSFCTEVPDLSRYVARIRTADTSSEKDAIYSSALISATRYAAPIFECAWTSSTGMIKKGLDWFKANKDNEVVKIWDTNYRTLMMNAPEPDQLLGYQKAAQKWRVDVGYGINNNTRILHEAVLTEYQVPGNIVNTVREMLTDMIRRRNEIINGPAGDGTGRGPVAREHIDWCREFINGKFMSVFTIPWGDVNKAGKSGFPLMATGLAKLVEVEGQGALEKARQSLQRLSDWLKANKEQVEEEAANKMCTDIERHIVSAEELARRSSAMRAQGAQMDTVFSSFYWLWRAGVTPETFPTVSQFLFELGKNPKGHKKMHKALASTPLRWGKKLVELFASDSFLENRIYMHPGVLTPGRMSEMGICFGVIPVNEPEEACQGSGHAKAILNYKTDTNSKNACATVIASLFDVQKRAYTIEQMDVVASEHLLHQSLVGKRSPFQNAYNVKGNATNVQIL